MLNTSVFTVNPGGAITAVNFQIKHAYINIIGIDVISQFSIFFSKLCKLNPAMVIWNKKEYISIKHTLLQNKSHLYLHHNILHKTKITKIIY